MLHGETLCMVGREQSENSKLEALAGGRHILLWPANYPGPSCLILAPNGSEAIETASALAAAYSQAPKQAPVDVQWRRGHDSGTFRTEAKSKDFFKPMLI